MRIIICDDDSTIIEHLSKLLTIFFKKHNLKVPDIVAYESGEELLSDTCEKDIVFLDIEMPGLNGIFVGNELKKQNNSIIIFIITSYMEYLDDAMKFHVFRYLSKPIDKQRLFRNMNDALNLYSTNTKTIPIETKEGVYTLNAMDIVCIEAIGRKVIIHTTTNDLLSIRTLKYWQENLPHQLFVQSHRSYIVNMAHINSFDHQLIYLSNSKVTAYLTRRNYTNFKNTYLLYLESFR